MCFGHLAQHAIKALHLIPRNCVSLDQGVTDDIFDYHREDLPLPETYQRLSIGKSIFGNRYGQTLIKKTTNILVDTLSDSRACIQMSPNIIKIMYLTLSVTASGVERANFLLMFY